MVIRSLQCNSQNRRQAVVFDLDGVLALDLPLLQEYIFDREPDWLAFNNGLIDVQPVEANAALARALHAGGFTLVILTNRNHGALRELTKAWLTEHEIPCDHLIMRESGQKYHHAKEDAMCRIRDEFEVLWAMEDDPFHVEMFNRLGVPTTLYPSGSHDRPFITGVELQDQ